MIHKSADVQSVSIGKNTTIWQYTVILRDVVIGDDCNINCHVFIEDDVIIGDRVTVKSGVQLWNGLRIGNDVFIGPNVTFTNDIIPRSKKYPETFEQTIIEDGASIGANSTIIAGNTIGKYSFVGAGSVITKPIPEYSLWFGNPARQMGYVTKKGEIINLDLKDKEGKRYELNNGEPILV